MENDEFYFEFTDDWYTRIFVEGDEPEGIMIQMDVSEITSDGLIHIPKDKAIQMAKLILKLTDDL